MIEREREDPSLMPDWKLDMELDGQDALMMNTGLVGQQLHHWGYHDALREEKARRECVVRTDPRFGRFVSLDEENLKLQ